MAPSPSPTGWGARSAPARSRTAQGNGAGDEDALWLGAQAAPAAGKAYAPKPFLGKLQMGHAIAAHARPGTTLPLLNAQLAVREARLQELRVKNAGVPLVRFGRPNTSPHKTPFAELAQNRPPAASGGDAAGGVAPSADAPAPSPSLEALPGNPTGSYFRLPDPRSKKASGFGDDWALRGGKAATVKFSRSSTLSMPMMERFASHKHDAASSSASGKAARLPENGARANERAGGGVGGVVVGLTTSTSAAVLSTLRDPDPIFEVDGTHIRPEDAHDKASRRDAPVQRSMPALYGRRAAALAALAESQAGGKAHAGLAPRPLGNGNVRRQHTPQSEHLDLEYSDPVLYIGAPPPPPPPSPPPSRAQATVRVSAHLFSQKSTKHVLPKQPAAPSISPKPPHVMPGGQSLFVGSRGPLKEHALRTQNRLPEGFFNQGRSTPLKMGTLPHGAAPAPEVDVPPKPEFVINAGLHMKNLREAVLRTNTRRHDTEMSGELEKALEMAVMNDATSADPALVANAQQSLKALWRREACRERLMRAMDLNALPAEKAQVLGESLNGALDAGVYESEAVMREATRELKRAQEDALADARRAGEGTEAAAAAAAATAAPVHPLPVEDSARKLREGRFVVQAVVGEGAYGVVMRCTDRGDRPTAAHKTVAVKEFKVEDTDPDADDVRRTARREVHLLRQMQHPHIVRFLMEFTEQDKLFIVMEYVPRNLLEVLEEQQGRTGQGGLPKPVVKHVMHQLCQALAFIHGFGCLYRDVKPENLLVSERAPTAADTMSPSVMLDNGAGELVLLEMKLCDFGFARPLGPNMSAKDKSPKWTSEDDALTDYVATRWYRAPELLLGPPFPSETDPSVLVRSPYGVGVDMWAVGCLMGECLDGEPLFPGDSDVDQLQRVQDMLGRLSTQQLGLFLRNPSNVNVNFGADGPPTGLASRYGHLLDDVELDFIARLLHVNPEKRMSGVECLEHEIFAGLGLDVAVDVAHGD